MGGINKDVGNLLQSQNHGFARRAAVVEVCRGEVMEEREGNLGEVDGEVREGWEGDLEAAEGEEGDVELWGKAVRRLVLCESRHEALRGEEVGM